jgi:hypothetical protein
MESEIFFSHFNYLRHFRLGATVHSLINHQLQGENKHIHQSHWKSDSAKSTDCAIAATTLLISTPKLQLRMLQHSVCAVFAHPPRFAITLNCLHNYKQEFTVYHVLHHLTGTLYDSVASTLVVYTNMFLSPKNTTCILYWNSQLGYMFRPSGGHHQATTMYWNCRYINDTLPTGSRVVYICIYNEVAV